MMDDRLTHCPYCSTIFSISEAELEQAYGAVRCGSCKKIFNASTHLFTLEETLESNPASLSVSQWPLFNSEPEPRHEYDQEPPLYSESIQDTVQEPIPSSQKQPHKPNHAPDDEYGQFQADSNTGYEQDYDEYPEHNGDELSHEYNHEQDFGIAVAPEPQLEEEPQSEEEKRQIEEQLEIEAQRVKAQQAARRAQKASRKKQQASSISLKADRNDGTSTLNNNIHFNAEPDTPQPKKPKLQKDNILANGLPWIPATAAAAIVAVVLLLLWSNTRSLSQSPGFAGFAEALCELSSCDHFLPSDFDSLEATQTEIIQNNTQLFADLLLNNPGKVALPFPAILVELRSSTGKVVAEHLYQPDQYLRGKPFADHILPPDLPVALTLPIEEKIQDLSNFTVLYFPAADR